MPKIKTSISASSGEFKANAAAMQALVADLAAKRAEVSTGGPDKLKERHTARGKLLPRDRVLRLIDPGSPFLELSPMAAWDLYTKDIHGAGIITGVGRVSGRECVIVCNDATIKGGTYFPMTVK
jgi:3-methylcrotonyl-CoA carboxylase beta subunit